MTTDSTAVVHCDSLARHYRQGAERIDVLTGLSLEVQSGERIAIIGTSGSGKTTLLNLLGGLDDPDEGSVNVMGAALKPMNESKRARWRNRHLGFVYQFHHLLGEFSALENVAMPLLVAKTPLAEAKSLAREMLDRVGLAARCDHKPSELSGGERQRVAIARALVRKPACVLMDEPTGNLDPVTGDAVLALLMSLNRELAISFVVVTHDAQVAARMDRVLSLAEGCLTEVTESRSVGQGL